MPDATPGQVAFVAFQAALRPIIQPILAWSDLPDTVHACWEAAAAAVLAAQSVGVVHRLCAGVPLCGFTRKAPGDWPEGHRWSAYHDDVTCQQCKYRSGDYA
jgi:hypothetical protein